MDRLTDICALPYKADEMKELAIHQCDGMGGIDNYAKGEIII